MGTNNGVAPPTSEVAPPRVSENGNGAAAAEEEDDPVVHEIPVFLAKTLADKLYVFQVSLAVHSVL